MTLELMADGSPLVYFLRSLQWQGQKTLMIGLRDE